MSIVLDDSIWNSYCLIECISIHLCYRHWIINCENIRTRWIREFWSEHVMTFDIERVHFIFFKQITYKWTIRWIGDMLAFDIPPRTNSTEVRRSSKVNSPSAAIDWMCFMIGVDFSAKHDFKWTFSFKFWNHFKNSTNDGFYPSAWVNQNIKLCFPFARNPISGWLNMYFIS